MTTDKAKRLYKAGQEEVIRVLLESSEREEKLKRRIYELQEDVKALKEELAKLSKNSTNSSKRPSSDDITKPKRKKKGKGKKKIGGQPGHPRHERPPFPDEEIDQSHDYVLEVCPDCANEELTFLDLPPRIIQQMELKELMVTKEEHISYAVWCDKCQEVHYETFPPEVVREGLFKEKLTALVAFMKHVCHASFSAIRKFIRDVLGEKVSRGYLRKVIEKVGQSLDAPYEELLDRLPLEPVLNVDETGHKENGDKFWTWVFKADLYVLFKIDKSRGSKVLIDVLGKEFNGVLGCDYFGAYRKFMKDFNVSVQFCIAHLIRDIKYLTGLPDKETRAYGERLLKRVRAIFKVIHDRETFTEVAFRNALDRAKAGIISAALDDVPSRLNKAGKEEKREVRNMARRFRKHGEAYFAFITTPGMGPTNNVAEQAIRFIVIDRHVTQGTRSARGRRSNERLWTVIATCALQGRSAFHFILKAVSACFRDQKAPSLLSGFT